MTKNFVRGLGPRGPRVQSLVHKDEGRGPHSSIFGRQLHHIFFLLLPPLRLLKVRVHGVACGGG